MTGVLKELQVMCYIQYLAYWKEWLIINADKCNIVWFQLYRCKYLASYILRTPYFVYFMHFYGWHCVESILMCHVPDILQRLKVTIDIFCKSKAQWWFFTSSLWSKSTYLDAHSVNSVENVCKISNLWPIFSQKLL